MNRHCFTLDLKDDVTLINQYKKFHSAGNVWPDVIQSITQSGIVDLQIYLVSNRLFMIMEVSDEFTFERKESQDASNPKVIEWEELMWKFQQKLPFAKEGQKWVKMENIFQLSEHKAC